MNLLDFTRWFIDWDRYQHWCDRRAMRRNHTGRNFTAS